MFTDGYRKHFVNKFSPDQVKLSSKPKQTNLQLKTFCPASPFTVGPIKLRRRGIWPDSDRGQVPGVLQRGRRMLLERLRRVGKTVRYGVPEEEDKEK